MRRLLLLIAILLTVADCVIVAKALTEPQAPIPCSCWCSRKLCGIALCC